MTKTLTQSQFVAALDDMGTDYAALLIGAGASRSSGVLLAREVVHDIVSTEYCVAHGIDVEHRNRLSIAEVQSWLELHDWYRKAKANQESDYSAVFRQFKPTQDHQIRYIKKLCEQAHPSPAYRGLCHLVKNRIFPAVLTPNFDPLLENSYKGIFVNESSLRSFYSLQEFAGLTIESDTNILAHLHGSLSGYDISNLDEATRLLKPEIESAAQRLMDNYALVVVGYSGNDGSIMGLFEYLAKTSPNAFRRGVIYWCHRINGGVSKRVESFLNSVSQSFLVPISGFDQLVQDICERTKIGVDEFSKAPAKEPVVVDSPLGVSASLNLAHVKSFPDEMFKYRTGIKSRKEILEFRTKHSWWQGTVDGGYFWFIGNPDELPQELVDQISGKPEKIELNDASLADQQVWRIFSELANKGVARTLESDIGLRSFRGGRYFFTKLAGKDERKITYMSRKRKAPRRVVWFVFERGPQGEKTKYYCHESLRARIQKFNSKVSLVISPTRLFTKFGDDVWDSETARVAIGRSTGKVWNEAYDSLVRLWLDVLSREKSTISVRFSADGRKPQYRLEFEKRPVEAKQVERD